MLTAPFPLTQGVKTLYTELLQFFQINIYFANQTFTFKYSFSINPIFFLGIIFTCNALEATEWYHFTTGGIKSVDAIVPDRR